MLKLTQRLTVADADAIFDTVTLPYELRTRGRLRTTSDRGREVGLFLDRGVVLRHGACLGAESGEVLRVLAADEPVVTAWIADGLPLARLCYHLGNRHVSLAMGVDPRRGGWVRFPPDHVLEELAVRLGASLVHHRAPFDPEPGAYDRVGAAGEGHAGGHHHGHGGAHGHAH